MAKSGRKSGKKSVKEEDKTKSKNDRKRKSEEVEVQIPNDEENPLSEEKKEEAEAAEEEEPVPQLVGKAIRVSGKAKRRRSHYDSFEYDGRHYELEDSVLITPEIVTGKPPVVIIKDIAKTCGGNIIVQGQWFYRPEQAEKSEGGNWNTSNPRELYYSFHRDEVPAETVMHKCMVHFIPLHKKIPAQSKHPGFIVQNVYDTEQKQLFELRDKGYEDSKQQEIDILVEKTVSRLGELPDVETHDTAVGA